MEILSAASPAFQEYGRIVHGCEEITAALVNTAREVYTLPQTGLAYTPSSPELEGVPGADSLLTSLFGGLPGQIGCCYGRNAKMNCLEYHRDSEYNLSDEDFILLLAKQTDIKNGQLDTDTVKAFRVDAGVLVEIYATTMHYAPCHADAEKGFRVVAIMSKGSNTDKPEVSGVIHDDPWLWARNKWLLAHPDSGEAQSGAYVGLVGKNIDLDQVE